ncbi:dephospho-CoA kinase [Rhodosalinus sp.]|uniref:dephospho-CoA kinase n=1 Tax=Rhodosalinus sp. TaxID=2047741 RepID=UPI003564C3AE
MVFRLGLTGSIGMGKTATARIFAEEGCAVWDADAAVHRAYAKDGPAVGPLGAVFPEAIEDGSVSREALRRIIAGDSDALSRIEAIVHPLVTADRARFAGEAGSDIVVFDIPLLFETGAEREMDAVAVVTAPAEEQRRRVLARGSMSEADFEGILARQMPDAEKRARADYVIVTDTPEHARQQVREILADIRRRLTDA